MSTPSSGLRICLNKHHIIDHSHSRSISSTTRLLKRKSFTLHQSNSNYSNTIRRTLSSTMIQERSLCQIKERSKSGALLLNCEQQPPIVKDDMGASRPDRANTEGRWKQQQLGAAAFWNDNNNNNYQSTRAKTNTNNFRVHHQAPSVKNHCDDSKRMSRIVINCATQMTNRCAEKKLLYLIAMSTLVALLLSSFTNINQVQALNCYHCSSADNPGCDESFTGRANYTDTDCEKAIGRPAKVCRKIVQYIEHKKVVIRSCGYVDEHESRDRKSMCYKRSGTFALMMESCVCYEDNCNHSASLVPSFKLLATSMSALVLIIFYQFKDATRRPSKHWDQMIS